MVQNLKGTRAYRNKTDFQPLSQLPSPLLGGHLLCQFLTCPSRDIPGGKKEFFISFLSPQTGAHDALVPVHYLPWSLFCICPQRASSLFLSWTAFHCWGKLDSIWLVPIEGQLGFPPTFAAATCSWCAYTCHQVSASEAASLWEGCWMVNASFVSVCVHGGWTHLFPRGNAQKHIFLHLHQHRLSDASLISDPPVDKKMILWPSFHLYFC